MTAAGQPSTGRALLWGALAALVVVAIAGGGGYLYLRSAGGLSRGTDTTRVALVIPGADQDGAVVAQLIGLVESGSGPTPTLTDVDPDTRVRIPGTTFDRLGDAFSFGGGAAVAAALPAPRPAWVAVPQDVWAAAVDAKAGVDVTLPVAVDVFDGSRLTSLPKGGQRLDGAKCAALMRGMGFLATADRAAVRKQLLAGIAAALAASPAQVTPTTVKTDLTSDALASWLSGGSLKSNGL
jgi:anionic cell wall polymer biosynthesis LytR-Cps2A-Psr (LCP) family protein